MEVPEREKLAVAFGLTLGVPAAFGAFASLGLVGGIAATLAVIAGGTSGYLMMVPDTASEPRQRLNPDVRASLDTLFAACDEIGRSEVEAALRHSAQTLLLIANDASATVADMSFVILNMESLVGIAGAWKRTEASIADPASGDTLASFTITTISDVTRNGRFRYEALRKQSRDSLEIELAVTRRIVDEDRKGMQP